MNHTSLKRLAIALFSITLLAASAATAETTQTVKVALLDGTSLMGLPTMMGQQGKMGQPGMMGQPGYMGQPGMMGQPGYMGQQGQMGQQGMMGQPGRMGMMSVSVDKDTVKAGAIIFEVTNFSKAMEHEMLVIAVSDPNAPLPYDSDSARVPEDKVNSLGEVPELEAGKSGKLELHLKPGMYLLICNIAGHYAAGMYTVLTVTP
jgi:uncharacterized cupredoxin-like copper-binding protein